jgi:hypothetical protein
MNTDTIDRDVYRAWWEAEGRGDMTVCPCGQPEGDLGEAIGRAVASRPGRCPRHVFMDREVMAQAIMAGTFGERDLTDDESRWTSWAADGRMGRA